MSESTNDWKGLSEPTLLRRQEQAEVPERRRPRRFSSETANELLFWAFHLCVVAIALAIVWSKINTLNRAVKKLLSAQAEEIVIVEKQKDLIAQQLLSAQAEAVRAQQAEHVRSLQFDAAIKVLDGVVAKATAIQTDVSATLVQIQSINQAMLKVTSASANAAQSAAQAAGTAANAAGAAAATSASTRSLVARKVVTSADKVAMDQQRAALAAKQKQLTKVIKNTKVRGPTIFQKIFGQ